MTSALEWIKKAASGIGEALQRLPTRPDKFSHLGRVKLVAGALGVLRLARMVGHPYFVFPDTKCPVLGQRSTVLLKPVGY